MLLNIKKPPWIRTMHCVNMNVSTYAEYCLLDFYRKRCWIVSTIVAVVWVAPPIQIRVPCEHGRVNLLRFMQAVLGIDGEADVGFTYEVVTCL